MTSAEDTSPADRAPGDAPAGDASPGGTTAEDIAGWMLETIRSEGRLDQDDAVRVVPEKFGPEWVRTSPNGHPALDREVVKAFRKAHDGTVQWDRDRRFWSPKR